MTRTDLRLESDGRVLVERLGGRWTASSAAGLCRCPAHDDRTPSLSVRVGSRNLLFHCFAGCSTDAILAALRRRRLAPARRRGDEVGVHRRDGDAIGRELARRLWRAARPLAGSPGEDYLAGRGLVGDAAALRFWRRTPDGPWPHTVYRPAMIAAVTDRNGLVAVHRTFLSGGAHGVPAVDRRAALGRLGTGAVRLGDAGAHLGLAEGIETALAVRLLFGLPCWATLGAERFDRVAIPAGVETVTLFLDHDAGGRIAETRARAGLAAARIEVARPEMPGHDWNDVLMGERRGGGLAADPVPQWCEAGVENRHGHARPDRHSRGHASQPHRR